MKNNRTQITLINMIYADKNGKRKLFLKSFFIIQNLCHQRSILALFLVVLVFSSCQKVINIDLNSVSPQTVIEGNISDQPGPYTVKISRTVNYNQTNVFPPVTGAVVTISDNAGNSETLTEFTPGTYTTSTLQGTPGRTYTLTVSSDGKTYTSVSTMPYPVKLDTLVYKVQGVFSKEKSLNAVFVDPPGIANFYAVFTAVNNVMQSDFTSADDNLRDGDSISIRVPLNKDNVNTGDSIKVYLESIDKNVREYFRLLRQLNDQGGFQSAPPANPITNISGGALGYFSAYAVKLKTIFAQ